MKTKILIVEDQQTIRQGLRLILAGISNVEVVGEAADGYTAISMAERVEPDLILMDIGLPGIGGIEALRRIKSSKPETKVLMITKYDEEDEVRASLSAGADGYCLKSMFGENLAEAISAVIAGQIWLDPALADRLLREFCDNKSEQGEDQMSKSTAARKPEFTAQESAVLEALVSGLTNAQIAGKLDCSSDAITNDIRSILLKLHVFERPPNLGS